MKFSYDHDLHIHSKISSCSSDPEQTNEAILAYAKKNGLTTICLTDHYWGARRNPFSLQSCESSFSFCR